MERTRGEADSIVLAHWPAMLQVACLVLGDRAPAIRAANAVRADLRRHAREVLDEGRPTAYLRRVLAEELRAAERQAPPTSQPPRTLQEAFADLPLDDRLLLAWDWTGLYPVEIAEATGLDARLIEERLRAVPEDLQSWWEQHGRDTEPEQSSVGWPTTYAGLLESRAHLAEGVEPTDREATAGRRSRARWVAAAVAGLLLVGGTVVATTVNRSSETGQETKRAAPSVPTNDPAWKAVPTWPARGNLAGEPKVQVAVDRVLPGAENRVLFANESTSTEVVVLSVPTPSSQTYTEAGVKLLSGSAGLSSLAVSSDSVELNDRVALLLPQPWTKPTLLVLAPPSVRSVDLTEQMSLDTQGRITRTWRSFPLTDGVVRIPLRETPDLTAARLRVAGTARPIMTWTEEPPPPETDPPCPTGDCTVESGRRDLARRVARLTGVPADAITVTMRTVPVASRLVSDLAGPSSSMKAHLTIGTARLPNGAIVEQVNLDYSSDEGSGSMAVSLRTVPAAEVGRRPVILPIGNAPTHSIFFVPGAASAQLVDDNGQPQGRRISAPGQIIDVPLVLDDSNDGGLVTSDSAGNRIGSWRFSDLRANDPLDSADVGSDF